MSYGEETAPKVPVRECPACGSNRIEAYLERDLTTFFFPVPQEMINKVRKEPFALGICNECSHIFQTEIKPALLSHIYNEFYVHYNLDTSVEFQKVYRERTISFLDGMVSNGAGGKDPGYWLW